MSRNIILEAPAVKTHILDKVAVYVQQRIPYFNCQKMEIDTLVDPLSDDLVCRLVVCLTGKHHFSKTTLDPEPIEYISIPRTWWDHFKRDYFPSLKHKTVQVPVLCKQEVTYHTTNICPHHDMKFDQDHIHFLVHEFEPAQYGKKKTRKNDKEC